jgi:hypothetical protein
VTTHTRTHVDIHDALADLTFADAVHAALWIYDQEDDYERQGKGQPFVNGADAVAQACHALGIQSATASDPAPDAEVAS